MSFKHHQSKPDKNFNEVIRCLKDRCAGYWKDKEYPHHYAHLKGLDVCAYDTNKMGNGFPDVEIWVSWMCLQFEVKQERPPTAEQGAKGRHTVIMTDDEYYRAQLEETEVFFRRHHSSIIPIIWDRNQLYEWLCAMADFVLYCEGQAEGSDELLALFFPKAFQTKQTIEKE